SAAGDETGTNDFRVSDATFDGEPTTGSSQPDAVYDPDRQEFLVVWTANRIPDLFLSDNDIYGQLLDAATGGQIGDDDFRIAQMGSDPASGTSSDSYIGQEAAAAYGPGEYLVVWRGSDDLPGMVASEDEIFGQRLVSPFCGNGVIDTGETCDDGGTVDGDGCDAACQTESSGTTGGTTGSSTTGGTSGNSGDGSGGGCSLVPSAARLEIGTNDFRISDMG